MKALYIGRFQPFHKGHLEVVKYLTQKFDHVIIGIGSSQYKDTADNPFSSDERSSMIKNSLKQEKIENYSIVLIPDIHNPPKWADHVLTIVSDFDVAVSNSEFTRKLFDEKGFRTQDTPKFNEKYYSGTEIRNRIFSDEKWEDLVPRPVCEIVKKIDGVKRIKKANAI